MSQLTPFNPSRNATARVTNPLPIPTVCPHCEAAVEVVTNDKIYGRLYGDWPWACRCTGCDAQVGFHPFTGIPLGTLATREMREARKSAKAWFNALHAERHMTRTDAYAWLAKGMGIPGGECHFGWFNVEQCHQATQLVIPELHRLRVVARRNTMRKAA